MSTALEHPNRWRGTRRTTPRFIVAARGNGGALSGRVGEVADVAGIPFQLELVAA